MTHVRGVSQDLAWWRGYWKRISAQGVIIPASREDVQELVGAAHADKLVVLLQFDMGVTERGDHDVPADWAATDAQGKVIEVNGATVACVNGPYSTVAAPASIGRVVKDLRPDGLLGVGWSGLDRNQICHCTNCADAYRKATGSMLPASVNVDEAQYWAWVEWSRLQRTAAWGRYAAAARQQGGRDCVWTGLMGMERTVRETRLQDVDAIARVAPLLFVEQSGPTRTGRFRTAIDDGLLLTRLLGNRPVVAVTSTQQRGEREFVFSSGQVAEVQLQMLVNMAAGPGHAVRLGDIPLLDRRALEIAPSLMDWHKANARILSNRSIVAPVALVWSRESAERYARSQASLLSHAPYDGMVHALSRNHISYLPLDSENLAGDLSAFSTLILPNIAILSDAQAAGVREFVRTGGTLVATGETSLYDRAGDPRMDYALADVLGAHPMAPVDRLAAIERAIQLTGIFGRPSRFGLKGPASDHTYVRLSPEYAAAKSGPHTNRERNEGGRRHPVLDGFDDTDILEFGGHLGPMSVDADRVVLMTYLPPFPNAPIDETYMRVERTDTPGLIVGAFGKGRVAFMPADFDRRLGLDPIADHHLLVGNLLRWAVGQNPPVLVDGPANVAAILYRQESSLVLHLLNLTGADNQPGVVGRNVPVGPLRVSVELPNPTKGDLANLLTAKQSLAGRIVTRGTGRSFEFEIAKLVSSEVVLIR
jgi:hypothetical protein